MTKDINSKPYDEATLTKLEIFERYLQAWLPVFVQSQYADSAAICIVDDSRADLGDGYVRTLGVARDFRGRGLATLLLEHSFVYYRDRGRRAVQLGVDSESPTGANHLYEKVGMRPLRVIDAWSLPLT